jgi:hypothetical protein
MRTQVAVLGIVMLSLVGSAAGCHRNSESRGDEPRLAALKQERLAKIQLPGGALVFENDVEDRTSFGKPIKAHVVRVFSYERLDLARRGWRAAIKFAVASGWKMNVTDEELGEPIFGAKTLATGGATLILGAYQAGNSYEVSIGLEHRPCSNERCGRG